VKGKRVLSREARQRMGIAGLKNLSSWRARSATRERDLAAEVSAYRATLLRDAGVNPSASRLGLVEACVTTYAGLLEVRYQVIHARKSDVLALTERVSWLGSNLARLLKQLNIDAKPRPRCLADIPEPTVPEVAPKGSI
jgi:hypothetical protein